jgi:hypothetical protein
MNVKKVDSSNEVDKCTIKQILGKPQKQGTISLTFM